MHSDQLERQCTVATIQALVTKDFVGSAIMGVCIRHGGGEADSYPTKEHLSIGEFVQKYQGMSHHNKPILHCRRFSQNLATVERPHNPSLCQIQVRDT